MWYHGVFIEILYQFPVILPYLRFSSSGGCVSRWFCPILVIFGFFCYGKSASCAVLQHKISGTLQSVKRASKRYQWIVGKQLGWLQTPRYVFRDLCILKDNFFWQTSMNDLKLPKCNFTKYLSKYYISFQWFFHIFVFHRPKVAFPDDSVPFQWFSDFLLRRVCFLCHFSAQMFRNASVCETSLKTVSMDSR